MELLDLLLVQFFRAGFLDFASNLVLALQVRALSTGNPGDGCKASWILLSSSAVRGPLGFLPLNCKREFRNHPISRVTFVMELYALITPAKNVSWAPSGLLAISPTYASHLCEYPEQFVSFGEQTRIEINRNIATI